jgi:site-specific recombinase XerD
MKNLQSLIHSFALEKMNALNRSTQKIYLRSLGHFDLFQKNWAGSGKGWEHLQEEGLVWAWLRQKGQSVNSQNLGLGLRLLRDFLDFLKGRELISDNVIEQLYRRYPLKGWIGVAEAGKNINPVPSLEKLRPPTRFNGPWGKQMAAFILFKRRLGAQYEWEERTLNNLDRYLAEAGIPPGGNIPPILINHWLSNQVNNQVQTLNTKRRVAGRFFEHAVSLGLLRENPVRGSRSIPRRTLRPYIFSKEEIREILRRARGLAPIPFFPHRGATYEMIFATLYCLGLRISELCHLRLKDLDGDNGLLLIRPSKFYKSRLLPLGPKYLATLKQFVDRCRVPWVGEEAPLFLSYQGKPMRRGGVGRNFRSLAKQIGLKPNPGQRGPSLHSFRHTFAVHRLVRWYRQGEDVQTKLPFLSAFLGHVDIGSTQVYLDMIPELLEQVHLRFESHCGNHLINQGGRNHENV